MGLRQLGRAALAAWARPRRTRPIAQSPAARPAETAPQTAALVEPRPPTHGAPQADDVGQSAHLAAGIAAQPGDLGQPERPADGAPQKDDVRPSASPAGVVPQPGDLGPPERLADGVPQASDRVPPAHPAEDIAAQPGDHVQQPEPPTGRAHEAEELGQPEGPAAGVAAREGEVERPGRPADEIPQPVDLGQPGDLADRAQPGDLRQPERRADGGPREGDIGQSERPADGAEQPANLGQTESSAEEISQPGELGPAERSGEGVAPTAGEVGQPRRGERGAGGGGWPWLESPRLLPLLGLLVLVPVGGLVANSGFDGLYGQDAFAYADYAVGPLREALLHGDLTPPPFFWPPGYPTLVALVSLGLGPEALAGQVVSLVMGASVPVATALLARDLWPGAPRRALLAGALVAVCGQLWQSAAVVMSDTTGLALATFGLWAVVAYGRRTAARPAAAPASPGPAAAPAGHGQDGVPVSHSEHPVPASPSQAAVPVSDGQGAVPVSRGQGAVLASPGQDGSSAKVGSRAQDPGSSAQNDGSGTQDHGPRAQDEGASAQDHGSGAQDHGGSAGPDALGGGAAPAAPRPEVEARRAGLVRGARGAGWLLLAAVCLGWATITRWIYGLVALVCVVYALAVLLRAGPRRLVLEGGPALLVGGGVLAWVLVPVLAASGTDTAPFVGTLETYGSETWNLANALHREFLTTGHGFVHYSLPNGLYYAAAPLHPFMLTPMLGLLALPGAIVLLRQRDWRALGLLLGVIAAMYLFHAGSTWQNLRYVLAYLPPVAILVAVGADALLGQQATLRYVSIGWLIGGAMWAVAGGVLLTNEFIDRKQADLETVHWVEAHTPADARLLTFGPTLTFRHYGQRETLELFELAPVDLQRLVGDGRPSFLLLDVDNVEQQWAGRAPADDYAWLRDGPGLTAIGRTQTLTLFRVGRG